MSVPIPYTCSTECACVRACVCCVCECLLHVNLFFKEIKKDSAIFFFYNTNRAALFEAIKEIKNWFDLLQNDSLEEFSVKVERS